MTGKPSVSASDMSRHKPRGGAVMRQAKTHAIERAMLKEWGITGYTALSMEAIARRAGVGKAAVYRRWPSKLALVSDVLTRYADELFEVPDTGNLRRDLIVMLSRLRRLLRHPLIRHILPDLHAEVSRNPDLELALRIPLYNLRSSKSRDVFRRAAARGELADSVDMDLAADLTASIIYWRMIVTRKPASMAYIESVADTIMRAFGAENVAIRPGGAPPQTSAATRAVTPA